MKKILLVTTVCLIAFITVQAQRNKETLEGNGKLITRDVAVSSFDALKASGVYELQLIQGDKEAVKIEADENLQDLFTVRNEGTKLVIDMKKMENKNLNSKNKMRVYVTFRKLRSMDLSMVGNISAQGQLSFDDLDIKNKSVGHLDLKLTATKLNLENTSVGNVTLNGKAQNVILKNSGVGSIQAGNFIVQTMNIENTGVGSAEVNAAKELKVKDSFLGKVKNRGTAPVHKNNREVI